jgi:hypothetical protein
MGQRRARPIQNQNPLQITVEIYEEGRETPVDVLRQPPPNGFPTELLHHLSDFMARGFNAAQEPISLVDFGIRERRPRDDESEREGYECARLHKQHPTYSYTRIARQVCRYRNKRDHRCGNKCADRIRQAMKQYEMREEVEKIGKGEVDS